MDRNATAAGMPAGLHGPDTYWASFESVSATHVSLNYFEKLWLAWYTYMQNDVLATGIMSFVAHEAIYFGRSMPWIIIDMIPYFRQWKIQNVRTPCLPLVKDNHSQSYSKKFPPQRSNGPVLCSSC